MFRPQSGISANSVHCNKLNQNIMVTLLLDMWLAITFIIVRGLISVVICLGLFGSALKPTKKLLEMTNKW